jgi:demethylspheroidene O-methyltransferase
MALSNDRSDGPANVRWAVRWRRWRNGLFASPRFQRWAARTPLIDRVARSRASDLFDLVAGFSFSQILQAAVESGALDQLADGPIGIGAVAGRCGLSHDAALRLLRAAAALGLCEKVGDDQWMLSGQGAVLQADRGIQAMIRHHRSLYADLADPVALLRADRSGPTALSRFWAYRDGGETSQDYSDLMAASQRMVAGQVIDTYDFSRHRSLLDVGGGHGAFVAAVAQAAPGVRLGLFDLPPVALHADRIDGRVAIHAGDFFSEPLPRGYDCISLVRILHDHDDEPALNLLKSTHAALEPGGRVVVAEPMARANGAERMGDAYFGFYLWAMGSGRPRTAEDIGGFLRSAGFASVRQLPTSQPLIASVIVAER